MIRRIGVFMALLLFVAAPCGFAFEQSKEAPSPAPTTAPAPEPKAPPVFYRLDLKIKELDGEKLIDTRNYWFSLQRGVQEYVMAGSEVPYRAGATRDIGVRINATIRETDGSPWLTMTLEISDQLPPEKAGAAPVLRRVNLGCRKLLPPGRLTTVGMVEDPATRRRFQVDVAATKQE